VPYRVRGGFGGGGRVRGRGRGRGRVRVRARVRVRDPGRALPPLREEAGAARARGIPPPSGLLARALAHLARVRVRVGVRVRVRVRVRVTV